MSTKITALTGSQRQALITARDTRPLAFAARKIKAQA